ncbi:MAG: radical SAM protein [bacterium]|nr:radical SAM protein [bacterium]
MRNENQYENLILLRLSDLPANASVCIYGCGEAGLHFKKLLETERKDIRVSCFMDTFRSGNVDGIDVIQAKNHKTKKITADFILIASLYVNDIIHTLRNEGIGNYKIIAAHLLKGNRRVLRSCDMHPGEAASGAPRILFIAPAHSTHTHSWVKLLENEKLDVRVFGIGNTAPPKDFPLPTYTFSNYFPGTLYHDVLEKDWLAEIIRRWRPVVIHTLGLDPASYTYLQIKKSYGAGRNATWIVTARGGPEFALKRLMPENVPIMRDVLQNCDWFVADNQMNYDFALELGLNPHKLSPLGVVPGTGGIDINEWKGERRKKTSQRERIILWPKAYECPASKALPVFEALQLCWERIKPCKIHMLAMNKETSMWFHMLPDKIKRASTISKRIDRNDVTELMRKARILLAPSLSDGIPNVLYEAMAAGTFPLLSPLATIRSVVTEANALFACNLYPAEIAEAIVTAMNDDSLVDSAAEINSRLVNNIADRNKIREKVAAFYHSLFPGKISITASSNVNQKVDDETQKAISGVKNVYVETSSKCNLGCVYCYRTRFNYSSKNINMSLKDFKKIIDGLSRCRDYPVLFLHAFGEPTLNPDLTAMIAYAHGASTFGGIRFVSNLQALPVKNYEAFFAKGLTDLYISLDSLDPTVLACTRKGSEPAAMLERLELLAEPFGDRITVITVLTRENRKEMSTIYHLIRSLGLRKWNIQLGHYHDGKFQLDEKEVAGVAETLETVNKNRDVVISLENEFKFHCRQPYDTIVFNAAGYMTPCCSITDHEKIHFGNIVNGDVQQMFYSPEFKAFREFFGKEKPEVCKECPYYGEER